MIGRRSIFWAALFSLAAVLAASHANAHSRTVSRSDWRAEANDWEVRIRLPKSEFDRMEGNEAWKLEEVRAYALERFVPQAAECRSEEYAGRLVANDIVAHWRWVCPQPAEALEMRPFFDSAPAHLHYARIQIDDRKIERIVTGSTRRVELGDAPPSGLVGSARSGVGHLMVGWDHILFLIGLAFLARSWRSLLGIVTAFTLAHAAGLILVAGGWFRPEVQSVESLIGLSIGIVSLEAIMVGLEEPQRRGWRIAIALGLLASAAAASIGWISISPWAPMGFAIIQIALGLLEFSSTQIAWIHACGFGTIHGLGIAGVLSGWGARSKISATTILGFNLGVEAGQILVASFVFLLLWKMKSTLPEPGETPGLGIRDFASALLVAVGVFWFVGRAIGLA